MDLLIGNVPGPVLDALRARGRARERGRSVQAEALAALERGVGPIEPSLSKWLRSVANPAIDVAAATAAIRAARDER